MRPGEPAAPVPGAGRPLDGVRILALEQMQSLPYATQLLARLGADVVKVEPPQGGDSGRGSLPAMTDPDGRRVGATFLRSNLGKRSVCVNLKHPRGRDLVLRLASRFDVIAENSRAGAMARLGLGYRDIAAVHPEGIYVSVSGFGNTTPTPYRDWPAYASIVEAMSGIYEMKRTGDSPGDGSGVTGRDQRIAYRELPTPPCGPRQHPLAWPGREKGNSGPARPTGSRPRGARPRRPAGHPRATR